MSIKNLYKSSRNHLLAVIVTATIISSVSGCSTGNAYRDRQIAGTAGGAAVGGVVGNAVTGGSTAGTIVGGVLGAGAGSAIMTDGY
jgi:osmotically inducible lipoprotein OsmB